MYMMKKFFAILLCLSMLTSCAALAETGKASMGVIDVNGAFELKCALPDGYALEVMYSDFTTCIAMVKPEDPGKPTLLISVAFSEIYSEIERLNDMDEDALKRVEDSFREEESVDISYMETAYGTKLMVVKEVSDGADYVDFYTVYKGYEVELILTRAQYDAETGMILDTPPITDTEIQMAVQFLSDMDFVGA